MNFYILELLHILFKRKALVIGTFLVIFGSVAIGTLFRTPMYRASGRFIVTGQRAYFRLSPEESWRSRQPEMDFRAINTEIQSMKSKAFLLEIAKALPSFPQGDGAPKTLFAKLIAALPFWLTEKVGATTEGGSSANGKGLWSFQDQKLEVLPVPNSDLVEVAYTDSDPKRAAAVVNTVLDAYPRYHARIRNDPASLLFYDKQKDKLKSELAKLEDEIKAYRAEQGIVSLGDQKNQLFSLLDKIKDRLEGARLDIDQGKGKIAEIERQLKTQPKFEVTTQDLIDPETKILHEKLITLEVERNALLQIYTEKDRRVVDKMNEIAAIKARLASSPGKKVVVGERIGQNFVHKGLQDSLMDQKVKLGQVYAKIDKLASQEQELTKELEVLNAKGYRLQKMEEDLAHMKDLYLLYSKKSEEARITTAMDKEKLVNVKVAGFSPLPTAPLATGVALALLLAAIVGVGGGTGSALALEYLHPTFHSALDAERHLELPVLALIPDLREKD